MSVIIYEKYERIKYIMFKDVQETLIKACNEILELNKAEDKLWINYNSQSKQIQQFDMQKREKDKIIKAWFYRREIEEINMQIKSLFSQHNRTIEQIKEI